MLNEQQKAQFWKEGYLLVENVVSQESLQAMKEAFADWVEESRAHTEPYGEAIDGRARFDVEPGHTAQKPGLRRVNAPIEVSAAYFDAMADSGMTDVVADLIGPNVKFHHSKINAKLPGGTTAVKWHQDFPFTPHSNDDLITALLMVDEVTEENGPLEVLPGSHTGPIHDLWHDGVFTGSVDNELVEMVELSDHPWFIGCQFHPEFTSRPREGHPLFNSFITAAGEYHQAKKS